MKKLFTLGLFLAFIVGIGDNLSAAQFVSRLSGNSNAPTARGYRIGAWNAKATWYDPSQVDTTQVTLPTYNDDVTISVGDSIYLSAAGYAKNLTVNGTVCMYNGATYINGDLTVGASGVFSIKSNAYCKNIYNSGKIWAYSTNYNSAKILCVGYTNSGSSTTTVASSDSITIINDGVIGGQRSIAAAGGNGCGFWIQYSNQAKALVIKHSDNVTSGYTFNVGGLFPALNPSGAATTTAASQNFNLYIKQSIALFVSASPGIFSLQNGDTFTGYTRNCKIDAGDTVFVATSFHTRASAPTASQGAMTYDVYGCLDMATYNRSKNEFDLYTSANSDSVIVNVKNGGSIVFGKALGFVQSGAGQITNLNLESGSTARFGYTLSAPTITTTNTTFPTSFSKLEVASNAYNVTLPAGLNYSVNNSLAMTSGKLLLGTSNLTVGSISSSSATSYVVTNGTGKLSTTAKTTGTLFPIGTASAYTPMTITPAADVVVAASVSGTATGTYSGYGVNATEWTVTPATATTAGLVLTPSAATYTDSPAIFSGINSGSYAAKTDATVATGAYTASGVALDAVATVLATGGVSTPTAIETNTENGLQVYAFNKAVVLKNAKAGDLITVYGANGAKVLSSVMTSTSATMPLSAGIYMVKVGAKTTKVAVF